jgi:hypothetical protein
MVQCAIRRARNVFYVAIGIDLSFSLFVCLSVSQSVCSFFFSISCFFFLAWFFFFSPLNFYSFLLTRLASVRSSDPSFPSSTSSNRAYFFLNGLARDHDSMMLYLLATRNESEFPNKIKERLLRKFSSIFRRIWKENSTPSSKSQNIPLDEGQYAWRLKNIVNYARELSKQR